MQAAWHRDQTAPTPCRSLSPFDTPSHLRLAPPPLFVCVLQAGVAVRSGHLCTQPVHRQLGVASSLRASPYLYNTAAEVDAFVDALKDSIAFFS